MSKPPRYTIQECDRILTARGQVLEMEEVMIHGQRQRVWKNLPPTFRDFLLKQLLLYSDRTFLSSPLPVPPNSGRNTTDDPREQVTYGDVLRRSLELAAWLRGRGVGVGSRVAIGGGNSTGWVVSFVAAHLVGAIAVCLNAWLPRDVLVDCLEKTRPDVVLLDLERTEILAPLRAELHAKGVGEVVCWDAVELLSPVAKRHVVDVRAVAVQGSSRETLEDILQGRGLEDLSPESDAVIFFSSGTSGPPKAVLSTQRMALTNLYSGLVAPSRVALRNGVSPPPLPRPTDPQKTVLLSIPLFHVTGCLSWLMRAFFAGSKMVYLRRWSGDDAVRLILQEKVTVIGGVPAVVASILQNPSLPNDRGFETVFYGGAPPSKQLAGEVKARWPKAGIVQGYGLSETNAYVCSTAGGDYLAKPESTGPPVPVCDIRIVDPTTRRPVSIGETGLLLVRGPQVMKCYYGDPDATREAMDRDGWLDTGDVACVDQEGFVYIKDRLKDLIIRGGENISSADVENALYADRRVAEAVAIGVPDRIMGEKVGAVVSLKEGTGARATEADLMEVVRPLLGRRACPAIILVLEGELPRNVNGKVVKKDIKPILVTEWEKRGRAEFGAAPAPALELRAKL